MAKMKIFLSRKTKAGTFLDAELELPASKYEIEDALQRVQSDGSADYSIEIYDHVSKLYMPENFRLDELNYFAARIEHMSEFDRDYLQSQIFYDDTPPDMKRLINMTFNPEYLEAVFAGDFKTVGEVYMDSNMFPEVNALSDEVSEAIDLDKIGRLVAKKEDGKLLENGWYAFPTGKPFEEVYDGVKLPEIMGITNEGDYVFKLLVAEPPENDPSEAEGNAVWITLPGDDEEFDRVAKQLQQTGIEDCIYLDMKSAIPQITSEIFGDMGDFETLHEIAERYAGMDADEQMHYKAALEYAGCKTVTGCKNVLDKLKRFEFMPELCSLNELGTWFMARHGGSAEKMQGKDMSHIGKTLLDVSEHGLITGYGYMVVNPEKLDISQLDRPFGEQTVSIGDVHISPDFQCDQTSGYPTVLAWNKDNGTAILQPAPVFDDDSKESKQCLRECADWGVHPCASWEDYNGLLESIGEDAYYNAAVSLDDEDEDEEFGEMTLQ